MKVYGWSTQRGGCHWYRIREPLRGLRLLGHETRSGNRLDSDVADWADTVVTHLLHDDKMSEGWEILAKVGQHRLVYDIDDAMWNAHPAMTLAEVYTPDRLRRIKRNIQISDVVTTPSEVIAEHVGKWNANVHVLPNYVPKSMLSMTVPSMPGFLIGYQGSPTHSVDLPIVAPSLRTMLHTDPCTRVVFYGPRSVEGLPVRQVDCVPWNDSVPSYYASLRFHVGIGPLIQHPFNEAKSALRAVEYAALGIPSVLSDVGPYRRWVRSEGIGVLVSRPEDWTDVLAAFRDDPLLRRQMGQEARVKAAAWTTETNAVRWQDAYQRG